MAHQHYLEDVATGLPEVPKLRIAGRPRQGGREQYVFLQEPDEPVLMHYTSAGKNPHFRRGCPFCDGTADLKPFWYIGASPVTGLGKTLLIVELTQVCVETARASALREYPLRGNVDLFGAASEAPTLSGLIVEIVRGDFPKSPRVLRAKGRAVLKDIVPWPYHTRHELARIWNIPVRPKIYKEGNAS